MTPEEAEKLSFDRKTLYDSAMEQALFFISQNYIPGKSLRFLLVAHKTLSWTNFQRAGVDYDDIARHVLNELSKLGWFVRIVDGNPFAIARFEISATPFPLPWWKKWFRRPHRNP